jgi:hypothetical protein
MTTLKKNTWHALAIYRPQVRYAGVMPHGGQVGPN